MYLYRVCFPPDKRPEWEDLNLPGGNNTFTGYWTPHLDCACAIYRAREKAAGYYFGAGTYARIWRIRAEDAVISPPPPGAKMAHREEFDRDEIFVTSLRAVPEDVTKEVL